LVRSWIYLHLRFGTCRLWVTYPHCQVFRQTNEATHYTPTNKEGSNMNRRRNSKRDDMHNASFLSGSDGRIIWVRGPERPVPRQIIGVLELRSDDTCRAVLAERTQVDGRCHVLLARNAWGGKDLLDTRWWSLVLDDELKVDTIRNGSCGDPLLAQDVPRIVRA